MGDFSKRQYGGHGLSSLQGDIERAVSKLRGDMTAASIPYTPVAGVFADPQPTTLQEAMDRAFTAVFTAHGLIPIP